MSLGGTSMSISSKSDILKAIVGFCGGTRFENWGRELWWSLKLLLKLLLLKLLPVRMQRQGNALNASGLAATN